MTADEFKTLTGRDPQDDDLERVNCELVGTPGHMYCGLNAHGVPAFMGSNTKPEDLDKSISCAHC